MPSPSKPISQRVPNPMSGNDAAIPIEFSILDLATAQAEYDAHRRRRVDHQPLDAPPEAHRLRSEWLKEDDRLAYRLRLAKSAAANKWETHSVARDQPESVKYHRFGHSHPCPWRKTAAEREEEYRGAVAKLSALTEGTPEWSRARNRISWMKKAMMRARREEMRLGNLVE